VSCASDLGLAKGDQPRERGKIRINRQDQPFWRGWSSRVEFINDGRVDAWPKLEFFDRFDRLSAGRFGEEGGKAGVAAERKTKHQELIQGAGDVAVSHGGARCIDPGVQIVDRNHGRGHSDQRILAFIAGPT